MPASSAATLVVKFLDTVNSVDLISGPYAKVFAEPPSDYVQSVLDATARMAYPVSYPVKNVEGVLKVLSEFSVQMAFLFSETTPKELLDIVNHASDNAEKAGKKPAKPGQAYAFANFFNYFKIQCADDIEALKIQERLMAFVLIDPRDYFSCPLHCVYVRSPSVLASSLNCTRVDSQQQDFWASMGILGFWEEQQRQFGGSLFQIPPQNQVCIHEIEDNWARHRAFPSTLILPDVVSTGSDYSLIHGCAVLGLLAAKWARNVNPKELVKQSINGIVPMVQVKLYPPGRANNWGY